MCHRIKKAYRRKALELHPDRNYGNVEATTTLFAEVQAAYEVLSDPEERAWYDSHRDAVLREGVDLGQQQFHNVRVTTAENILSMLSRVNGRLDFSDSPSGFYSVIREVFDNLAQEEAVACEWGDLELPAYPSFGHADDSFTDVVRPFYAAWTSFATQKIFSWNDIYRLNEAPDRRVRRMMEKENKRLRDEGIREFNDAVRSLVAFVKKRDPRYKMNAQSEADRQKTLRDASDAQAARMRAANHAKISQEAIPEWAKAEENEITEDDVDETHVIEEVFECVVCNKVFKSEKQFEAHERSKKHAKAVQHLRRQMQSEEKDFELDVSTAASTFVVLKPIPASDQLDDGTDEDDALNAYKDDPPVIADRDEPDDDADGTRDSAATLKADGTILHQTESPSLSEEEYASRDEVERRFHGSADAARSIRSEELHDAADGVSSKLATVSIGEDSDDSDRPKLGKAKKKRAKKAVKKMETSTTDVSSPSAVVMQLLNMLSSSALLVRQGFLPKPGFSVISKI